ncbi:hypothetical protein D3C72_1807640 [compost metagenome]
MSRLQHPTRAPHVDIPARFRLCDRTGDRHHGRQVHDAVTLRDRLGDRIRVPNVADDQLDALGQVLGGAGLHVVEHPNAVPFGQQPAHDRRADEPCSSRDEYLHSLAFQVPADRNT